MAPVPAMAMALGLALTLVLSACGPKSGTPPASAPETPPGQPSAPDTNAPAPATPPTPDAPPAPGAPAVPTPATPAPGAPPTPPGATPPAEAPAVPAEVQVSFQGANVDMIVQWLAETTGKTVIKHPRVQCQLTLVSSRKVSPRQAIDLVYRALAIEGFNAIETDHSILIVPEGQDVRLSPGVVSASDSVIPDGHQRLLKIFSLDHVQAAEVRDKIRPVLSDRATVEIDERSNQLLVTDFNNNLRLLVELMKDLDVVSVGDAVVEVIPLRHAQAEEIGNLVSLIVNAQPAPPPSPSGGSGSSRPPGMPPGMSISMPSPSPSPSPGGPAGSGSAQQVRIWPDKTANRLIVSTPRARLQEVRQLVEILDKDKPDDVSVRVLPLRHVQAADFVREIGPLYQRLSGRSMKDVIEITANERSNSLIILSSLANFEALQQLLVTLDTDEAQEMVIQTFSLKNADAQDVAKQLQELGEAQSSASRSPYYFIYSSQPRGASKKPSFVADRRRNAVVVQAPPAQMDGFARMIRELDEPVTDDSLAPRIYQLKYVSAVDIEDVLNELFLRRQQQRSYWDFWGDSQSTTADRDVGRLYGKVRITSEPYSNTIIITSNSRENLAVVEEILEQLDVPSQAGETTLRVPLRFAKAATVANNLNVLFAKNGSPPLRPTAPQNQPQPQGGQQQQSSVPADASFELGQESREDGYFPWLGGQPDTPRSSDGRATARQVSDLVGRVRVVPDHRSNALLVSANVHLLTQITKLIEDLDAPTAQVLIEARIVEVSTDAMDKLGVRWSPDGSRTFTADDYDGSILGGASTRYIRGFGEDTRVNTGGSGGLPISLSTLRSGVLDASINLDVLVQFLRRNTDATVLAEPQINIADNEMGRLFVGQQVPFIDRSQTTDVGGLTQSFQYKRVGIILEVTPHINIGGDVALKIRAESSSIQSGQTLFGGAILDTRTFRTDVTVKDNETLVLGGIIQKQISDTRRKVPVLGDIPVLGLAFRKKDKLARDVQLMVFLRPKITRTPEEARALLQDIDHRAPLLRPWRDGINAIPETDPGTSPD
ncbi:MAG: hypothetical protein KF833_15565 [Verrucomicrobiae bacterium]|nr:hypothetical protein [Verrucomicrobiae bacterium]